VVSHGSASLRKFSERRTLEGTSAMPWKLKPLCNLTKACFDTLVAVEVAVPAAADYSGTFSKSTYNLRVMQHDVNNLPTLYV
jgi:hypothetical protein